MSLDSAVIVHAGSLLSEQVLIVRLTNADINRAWAAQVTRFALYPNSNWPGELDVTHTDPIAFALRRITGQDDVTVNFVHAEIAGRRYALGDAALANVRAFDNGDRQMPFMTFALRAVERS